MSNEGRLVEVGPAAPRARILLRRRRGVAGGPGGRRRAAAARVADAGGRAGDQGRVQDGEGWRRPSCNGNLLFYSRQHKIDRGYILFTLKGLQALLCFETCKC